MPSPSSGGTPVQHLTDRAVTAKLAPTKVAILGAGRGGTALLDLLHQIPSIKIVGIMDRDPSAPGIQRAQALHIPVTYRPDELVSNHGVNLIMDVTGDPAMEEFVYSHKQPTTDVLSGSASRVLWELVRHEANLQAELFHAEKLAGIGSFATGIAHDINNPLQLIMGLAENLVDETDLKTIHEQASYHVTFRPGFFPRPRQPRVHVPVRVRGVVPPAGRRCARMRGYAVPAPEGT